MVKPKKQRRGQTGWPNPPGSSVGIGDIEKGFGLAGCVFYIEFVSGFLKNELKDIHIVLQLNLPDARIVPSVFVH